jgi:hypothetical protein
VDTTRTMQIIGLGGLTLPTVVESQPVAQTGFAMAAGGGVDFSIRHKSGLAASARLSDKRGGSGAKSCAGLDRDRLAVGR